MRQGRMNGLFFPPMMLCVWTDPTCTRDGRMNEAQVPAVFRNHVDRSVKPGPVSDDFSLQEVYLFAGLFIGVGGHISGSGRGKGTPGDGGGQDKKTHLFKWGVFLLLFYGKQMDPFRSFVPVLTDGSVIEIKESPWIIAQVTIAHQRPPSFGRRPFLLSISPRLLCSPGELWPWNFSIRLSEVVARPMEIGFSKASECFSEFWELLSVYLSRRKARRSSEYEWQLNKTSIAISSDGEWIQELVNEYHFFSLATTVKNNNYDIILR